MKQRTAVLVGGPDDGKITELRYDELYMPGTRQITENLLRLALNEKTHELQCEVLRYRREKVRVEQEIYEAYVFPGTPEGDVVKAVMADRTPRIKMPARMRK